MSLRTYATDVAVVGAGAAGMVAALAAKEKGAEVLLLGKEGVGRGTCTSLAGGFFNASSDGLSPEEHCQATLVAGRGINDRSRVELVVDQARPCLERLVQAGIPLIEAPRGMAVDNRGNRKEIPGVRLAESLRQALERRGVPAVSSFHCLDLLTGEGRIAGVLGLGRDGEPAVVSARCVILATGGAGGIYLRNDNPAGIVGDGYAMALRAGCELQDMEFVQFYPLGIAEPGLPSTLIYPPYSKDAKLLDSAGRDVLRELPGCTGLHDAIIRFRDAGALLFHRKHLEGGLYLDLTGVAEPEWTDLFSLRLLARTGFDFRRRRLRVAPTTHFFMGGVVVDNSGRTSVPGLYAAGEVAAGFHGANRMGGNALTEAVVFGFIAGACAAEEAERESAVPAPVPGLAATPWAGEARTPGQPGELAAALRELAWEKAGLVRSREGIEDGLRSLSELHAELESLRPATPAEARRHHQAGSGLVVLRCILEASLRRTESRGAFYREDYPETDDGNWRRNIRIRMDGATGKLIFSERGVIP